MTYEVRDCFAEFTLSYAEGARNDVTPIFKLKPEAGILKPSFFSSLRHSDT